MKAALIAVATAALPLLVRGQVTDTKPMCGEIVGVLATDFKYGAPISNLSRVEIRQCARETGATIQLVAWRSGRSRPVLTIDTSDFGVVQSFARASLFVIETGGATRDQIFVIEYQRGEPKLVIKRVTKGTAEIKADRQTVDIVISGIYAGEGPPRSESHHFTLDHSREPQ